MKTQNEVLLAFPLTRPTATLSLKGRGKRRGFTLIELLVVVLIIGILAAVAVPQYKKAVVKTNLANALPSIKNIIQAQELHFLEKGTYAGLEKNLSVTVPKPQDVRIDLNHSGKNILRVTVCPGITKQEECSPYGDKRVIIADVHFSRESSHPGQASCLYKKPYGYLCKLWCDTFSPCWQNWNSF